MRADVCDPDNVDTVIVTWQLVVHEPTERTDPWANATMIHLPTDNSPNQYVGNATYNLMGVSKATLRFRFIANDTLGNLNQTDIQEIVREALSEASETRLLRNFVTVLGITLAGVAIGACMRRAKSPTDTQIVDYGVEGDGDGSPS